LIPEEWTRFDLCGGRYENEMPRVDKSHRRDFSICILKLY
jgi:hypothetical protein